MKRCIAYVRVKGLPNAWRPCRKHASQGSAFCKPHANGVDGAVLGMLVHGFGRPETRVPAKRSPAEETLHRRNGHKASPAISTLNKLHG